MSKEILLIVDALANEKDLDRDSVFVAVEKALAVATEKSFPHPASAFVTIDRETGDYQTQRQWLVVENALATVEITNELGEIEEINFDYHLHMHLAQAQEDYPNAIVGQFIRQPIESVDFGRIGAQSARQIMNQQIRMVERQNIVQLFSQRVGELVPATVKRVDRGNVIVDLGRNVDGIIYREGVVPKEILRPGAKIRAVVKEINDQNKGPQITLIRNTVEIVKQLFSVEVPEIGEGRIEIVAANRIAGVRSKVAVRSLDSRVMAYGACIGLRGSRVQSVQDDLAGERIDVVEWDESPSQYVLNALSISKVEQIIVDEDNKVMDLAIHEDELAQAIGKSGQNVRMASELTGWDINVMNRDEFIVKQNIELDKYKKLLIDTLAIDEPIAKALVGSGILNLESIVTTDNDFFYNLEGFNEEVLTDLRAKAQDAILMRELSGDKPEDDLLQLKGVNEFLAYKLANNNIKKRDDLADLSTFELMDIDDDLDEGQAARIIKNARAHWYQA